MATCVGCDMRHCYECDPNPADGQAGESDEDDAYCVSFPFYCQAWLQREADQEEANAEERRALAEEEEANALAAVEAASAAQAAAALAATRAAEFADAARTACADAMQALAASKEKDV